MGEGRGSTLVHLLVVVLSLVAFGFAIAAERRRSIVDFLVAEACLIAGATRNAYHTKYRGMIYAQNFSCETLRKGVFITGAVFVLATMILNVYCYMYFIKATTAQAAQKTNRASSNVGMTGHV